MRTQSAARNDTGASSRKTSGALALTIISLAQIMIILDATVVNVALPTIQRQLHFSPTNLEWVINGYAVTFGGLLLLGGRIGDLYGRRRLFIFGVALFTLASFFGGIAQNEIWLIVTRIIQGVGGAIVAPTALSLLADTFPEGPQRNRAFGVYGAIAGGGGAVGLLLGGVLTSLASWRWVFFINIPLGAIVLLLIPRVLRPSMKRPGHLDLAGGLTVTAAVMSLVYGLSRAGSYSFNNTQTIVALILAAVFLIAFITIEAHHAQPLMPFRIFKNRNRAGTYGIALAIGASIFSVFFFLTLFVQEILGFSPIRAGVGFMPLTAGIVVMAILLSRVIGKIGPRLPMSIGALFATGGLLWASRLSPTSSYMSAVLGPILVIAFGMGAIFVPMALTAVSGISEEETGLASALLNVGQQIGGSLGLSILVNMASITTAHEILNGVNRVNATTAGYSRAFEIGAAIAFLAFLIALLAIRRPRPIIPPASSQRAQEQDAIGPVESGPAGG